MPAATVPNRQAGDEMTQEERWQNEHINVMGHLEVPVARSLDPAPEREGWKVFFVCVHLDRSPQKHYIYKRVA